MILLTSGQPVRYPLMMKRIALITAPLLLLLSGCGKYGSERQARDACSKWQASGGSYFIGERPKEATTPAQPKGWNATQVGKGDKYIPSRTASSANEVTRRTCIPEHSTNQWLGMEASAAKDSYVVERQDRSVARHFRF